MPNLEQLEQQIAELQKQIQQLQDEVKEIKATQATDTDRDPWKEIAKLDPTKGRDLKVGFLVAHKRPGSSYLLTGLSHGFEELMEYPEENVAKLVTPFINPITMKLVKALIEEDRSRADLIRVCKVNKEELQMLDKLIALDLLEERKSKFVLTVDGRAIALILIAMSKEMQKNRERYR